ncbi:MAG: hypothetical protein M3R48_07865 [Candidatus Dormibacteraeota bacterium]|nr:hypothetical protein [Candidatus Dormibacteraeota bacterium]
MSDVPPSEPDLDAVAASIRADSSDIGIFFQVLGAKLHDSMPGAVELEREGGLFKKEHPIKRIVVHAGDDIFEAEMRHGAIACRHSHAVRGITLRSEEPGLDQWLRALVGVLAVQAQSNAQASAALRSLVT